MEWWGIILFFLTGVAWAWGAEISKKIKDIKVEAPYAQPLSFWGVFHRFNRFFFSLGEDIDIPIEVIQTFLGGAFFLPLFMIFGNWAYLFFLILGGGSFLLVKRLMRTF